MMLPPFDHTPVYSLTFIHPFQHYLPHTLPSDAQNTYEHKIILFKRLRCLAKGNRVNIPEPRHGDSHFGGKCGNANRPGDVAKSPGKSCLFFVRCPVPGIGLTGDRDFGTVKHRGSCGVQCTLGNP